MDDLMTIGREIGYAVIPAVVLTALLLRRRALCWVAGHRVGAATVDRKARPTGPRLVRTSRCTRCGRAFSGDLPAEAA